MNAPPMAPEQALIGWREWVSLEALGIPLLKAKIDTGARTSALHAFDVAIERDGGAPIVRFSMHPRQRRDDPVVHCQAPLADQRQVKDSGGHVERRLVIVTSMQVGGHHFEAEVTLTDRDNMGFRMLLGRTAMRGRFLVDPERSYLTGRRAEVRARLADQAR